MVPEQQTVLFGYLLGSLDDELRYVQEVTVEKRRMLAMSGMMKGTYLFPVLTFLGLTSALLKAANHSSHGAAS